MKAAMRRAPSRANEESVGVIGEVLRRSTFVEGYAQKKRRCGLASSNVELEPRTGAPAGNGGCGLRIGIGIDPGPGRKDEAGRAGTHGDDGNSAVVLPPLAPPVHDGAHVDPNEP